jgi:hypothetical protein
MGCQELNQEINRLALINKLEYLSPSQQLIKEEIELKIAGMKFAKDIIKTCNTCGGHFTREDSFAVNFGPNLSQEKMFARVCSFAAQKGKSCINPCKSISSIEQQGLGWNPVSDEEINEKLSQI